MAGCTVHQASNGTGKPLVPGRGQVGRYRPASARSYFTLEQHQFRVRPAVTMTSCLIANTSASMDRFTIYFDRAGSLYV